VGNQLPQGNLHIVLSQEDSLVLSCWPVQWDLYICVCR